MTSFHVEKFPDFSCDIQEQKMRAIGNDEVFKTMNAIFLSYTPTLYCLK